VSGIGTIRGVTFQVAQALSDVVDLVVEGRGEAVTIEGANDVVDYEILDGDGRSVAVRQAKARQEPGTWGASELAKIFCAWGEVDYADEAEFAFVTDASLSDSGQRLRDLIRDMRTHPDEEVLRATAASFRGGLPLPPLEVVQRLQILTRMGNADTVLAKVEMRILALLSRARLATLDDAVNAVNALLRTLFINGSSSDLARRTISRAEVLRALRLDEASLQDGLAWSQDTAAVYRVAVAEGDLQVPSFIPMTIRTTVPVPRVLDLVRDPDRDRAKANVKRSLDAVLGEQSAVLIGATGEGKSTALRYLGRIAAQRGLLPVFFEAAGHTAGALARRVRYGIEAVLKRSLTGGAIQHVLASPELLLLIDGVSEADATARESLYSDLRQLAAQRPLRIIASGRDLLMTIGGTGLPDGTSAFQIAEMDRDGRTELAASHGRPQAARIIEHRLGTATDNPMLFLMALSLADDGLPDSRAEVYEQFTRGLIARAGAADDDAGFAALGVAWAKMISLGQRTADHYIWRRSLGTALDHLATLPTWRGHASTVEISLAAAQRAGLLVRRDPDSGLAPLHDSFADFLAARAIARGEARLPSRLNTAYDETVRFMVELTGLDDALALRLAIENPLLACRIARQRQSRGRADADLVGALVQALADGQELPALTGSGLRLCNHDRYTGVVLADEGCQTVDAAQFDSLTREHPAIMLPPGSGSLPLAVTLWAAAVERELRPRKRLYQPPPPANAEQAGPLLTSYLREKDHALQQLASAALPRTVRNSVLAAAGPPGITGYLASPEPGHLGGSELPIRYRRSTEFVVIREEPPPDSGPLALDTVARMMRLHPTLQAAQEIRQALSVLTSYTWPIP
jgi:hypothetical protein